MNLILAAIFGLAGSLQLHLAKCFQILGIQRYKARKQNKPFSLPVIYIVGLMLSNFSFLWIILANRFAPAIVFTSMYSSGIVVVIFFAKKYLGEKLTKQIYIGLFFVLLGTALLSIYTMKSFILNIVESHTLIVYQIEISFIILAFVIVSFIRKQRILINFSSSLGLFCGMLSGLDAFLKNFAQNYTNQSYFLPQTTTAWGIFLSSLLFSTLAFLISQLAYAKGIKATLFISFFNLGYIGLPILLHKFFQNQWYFSILEISGISLIFIGLLFVKKLNRILIINKKQIFSA
jgi:drug/metabolite transporter (DMT)-like permease